MSTVRGTPRFSISSLKTDTTLSDLAHKAGHDIGNPLTSLISLASLIERAQRDPVLTLSPTEIQKYAMAIMADAWRVQSIVEKMVLVFSCRGDNSSGTHMVPVIQNSIRKMLKKPDFQQCDLIFPVPISDPAALIDSPQLEWLIGEMLNNALAHVSSKLESLPEEEREHAANIKLSLNETDGKITFSVENSLFNEIDSDLDQLFEPFFKASTASKGVGLGLTAAWAVLERAKGSIAVELNDSIFRVTVELPAA